MDDIKKLAVFIVPIWNIKDTFGLMCRDAWSFYCTYMEYKENTLQGYSFVLCVFIVPIWNIK